MLQHLLQKTKIQIIITLILSSLVSVLFVLTRIGYSNSTTYTFMIWNLFLAWIPLFFAVLLTKSDKIFKLIPTPSLLKKTVLILLFIFWFLFFPNALYIITDLFHLIPLHKDGVPLWYDLILIISFAWNGIILGFLSLHIIHRKLKTLTNKYLSWILTIIFITISSFGIYLGRYQRWNSWDVFVNPYKLFLDVIKRVSKPWVYPGFLGLTITFSIFFIINYIMFYLFIKFTYENNQK